MNEILITSRKEDIQNIIREIEIMQEEMDIVNEESTDLELRKAYHNHGITQGYICCLRKQEIELPDYGRLLTRQINISEKIRKLQEERLTSTAIPESPNNKD